MKIWVLAGLSATIGVCSSPGVIPPDGAPFAQPRGSQIVWKAPTNSFPGALSVYRVAPEAFSAAVVSNAMVICHFSRADLSKTDRLLFEDKHLLYFYGKNESGEPHFLYIAPTLGAMKYVSRTDRSGRDEGVPTAEQAEVIARNILLRFGIEGSLLGPKVKTGYDETSTRIDRSGHRLSEPVVVSRGVAFERRVDGIPTSEGWCFLIHFGSHNRIDDFYLKWRKLEPYQSAPVATPGKIVEMIKAGRAVLPPQFYNLEGLSEANTLSIVNATARYYTGTGREPLEFVKPYVELEMSADLGGSKATFVLDCPILSSDASSDSPRDR